MQHHDGQAFAADETDHDHHRPPGVASVHTRALVTWVAIYPVAALGMDVLARLAPGWPTPLRALVLTAVVVPLTVYITVPRLLLVALALSRVARPAGPFARPPARPTLQTTGEGS